MSTGGAAGFGRLLRALALCAIAAGPACTLQPEPRAGIISPLDTDGTTFVDGRGAPVELLGAVICCTDAAAHGWPLITLTTLEQFAAHDLNYTHIRLGPFTKDGEGPQHIAYADAGGNRQDLGRWNPAFWARVRAIADTARKLGIYLEVDLIDAWILERPELSPWAAANNVNGVDAGDCAVLGRAPGGVHEAFLRKAVAETGAFENVIYQIGNETFDCGGALRDDYELGAARIVRDELERRGHGPRLIGTNSEKRSLECHDEIDYVSRHTDEAPAPVCGKPLQVNETSAAAAAGFPERYTRARAKNAYMHLWRGDLATSDWERMLDVIVQLRDRGRASGVMARAGRPRLQPAG